MLRAKKKIRKLEKSFLARSGSAFAAAYKQSLASGQSVVISDQGSLYQISPDGSRKLLKQIQPPTPVRRGLKVTIR